MKTLIHMSLAVGLAIGGLGCRKESGHGQAHAHEEAGETSHECENRDALPLKDIRGLRFIQVPEPKAEGAWFPGEAISDEASRAMLSSPVKGILAGILVPPGRAVSVGTPLLRLQSPELVRLKADWISAKAKLTRTESELAREETLFRAQAGSRRELEALQSEALSAKAEEESARLALEARGLKPEEAGALLLVRAPMVGTVMSYKVQMGQGVEAGQEMGSFQAGQASLAQVELPLPPPEAWKPGVRTEVRKSDGKTWQAVLEGSPAALTVDTRRLSYRLRLGGRDLPLPGTPLEVRVPLSKAFILPQVALQQIEGVWGVFVKEGDSARFRPVRRGPELGSCVLVLEGLKPGESIAGDGAFLLKSLHLKRSGSGDKHEH